MVRSDSETPSAADTVRRRVLTIHEVEDLSELLKLREVRCCGWWSQSSDSNEIGIK